MISAQECSEQVRPGTSPISASIHEMPAGGCHRAIRKYLGVIAVFRIPSVDIQVCAVSDSQSVVDSYLISGDAELVAVRRIIRDENGLGGLVRLGRDRECHGNALRHGFSGIEAAIDFDFGFPAGYDSHRGRQHDRHNHENISCRSSHQMFIKWLFSIILHYMSADVLIPGECFTMVSVRVSV